jgi:FtsP/CotA-like multicopper oxidase with cupredoxin domain
MAASFITRLLASTSLVSNLQQVETNGLSLLGTLAAPQLAPFLQEKVAPGTMPWGGATAKNTNPYTNPPKTGVRRHYDLTISRGTIAPDGVSKAALLINGAFPGPTLEANWGDTFVVRVCNNITGPEEGTALHWHGFLQKGTPFNDGVPAVSQCPIPPGKEYTYVFKADLFGTSWYHSHYSAQYSGGAIGPIVVHGPSQSQYDIDIGPVMLGDYYHADYFSIVQAIETPGFNPPPVSDNNLINGKMNYDCDNTTSTSCTSNAGLSKFSFQSGKTHRLRLINPGSEGMQRFSIDGHTMTVIANDFVPVVPYNTSVVTLAVGQRTDVLVTANLASTSSVWMRSNISQLCSSTRQPFAVAPIYYESADTNATPRSTAWPYTETSCSNVSLPTHY